MIKVKKCNENGDSIVEVVEFDTIEEYIAYSEYSDIQEQGAGIGLNYKDDDREKGGSIKAGQSYTVGESLLDTSVSALNVDNLISHASEIERLNTIIKDMLNEKEKPKVRGITILTVADRDISTNSNGDIIISKSTE